MPRVARIAQGNSTDLAASLGGLKKRYIARGAPPRPQGATSLRVGRSGKRAREKGANFFWVIFFSVENFFVIFLDGRWDIADAYCLERRRARACTRPDSLCAVLAVLVVLA